MGYRGPGHQYFPPSKEIILRELISNARQNLVQVYRGPARDRGSAKFFFYRVVPVKTDAAVASEDFGVGVATNELFNNLGTFAITVEDSGIGLTKNVPCEPVSEIGALPRSLIKFAPEETNSTIASEDSGIGATKNDRIYNLCAFDTAGTKAFKEPIGAGGDISTVGQFGVGFYTECLVRTRRA